MMLVGGRASKNGELEETTLSRLEVWEESNLGKSTLSEVRNTRCSSPSRGKPAINACYRPEEYIRGLSQYVARSDHLRRVRLQPMPTAPWLGYIVVPSVLHDLDG